MDSTIKTICPTTSGSERDLWKQMLRRSLRAYANHIPDHWKKEGLIIKLSELLGLDEKVMVSTRLWFDGWVLCLMSDFFQRRIYYFGSHERKTEDLVHELIYSGDNVLDVGANIGVYTMLAAKRVGVSGKVISLEPVPQTFQQLSESLKLNRYTNVSLYNAAGWDQNRQVKMICSEPQNLGSFGVDIEEKEESAISVEAVRLDHIIAELRLPRISLIKVDVEGAELLVLKGAKETLSCNCPVLVLEIDPVLTSKYRYSPEDIWGYLKPLGYECYAIGEGDHFYSKDKYGPVLKPSGPTVRDNYVFIPHGVSLPRTAGRTCPCRTEACKR